MFHYTTKGEQYRKAKEFKIWEDAIPQNHGQPLVLNHHNGEALMNLEELPRTSTPIPDVLLTDEIDSQTKTPYNSWKTHLRDSSKRYKIRGTPIIDDNDIISGHFDMRDSEELMPTLNTCFLNLLINGPPPLNFQNQYINRQNHWVVNCFCLPCNCAAELCNINLPIGSKYDEYGNVVPSMNKPVYSRDPMCIYTN